MSKNLSDVFLNVLTAEIAQSGANAWTTMEIPLPVPRLRTESKGEVQVIEIFRVLLNPNWDDISDGSRCSGFLMLKDLPADPGLSSDVVALTSFEFDADGADRNTVAKEPNVHELHDYDGHGYLVATDSLWLAMSSNGQTALQTCSLRIFWRYRNIKLAEFLGMLQSQM